MADNLEEIRNEIRAELDQISEIWLLALILDIIRRVRH